MKTRNAGGKTISPVKTVPAKKGVPVKNSPPGAAAKNKRKTADKRPEKSAEVGKKAGPLTKTLKKSSKVKKTLPAISAPASKGKSVRKSPSKSAGVKAKQVKKKALTAGPAIKTADNKPLKAAIPKALPVSNKSLRVASGKIPEKTKLREAAGTRESKVQVSKPVLPKKKRKVGGRATGRKTKSVALKRGTNVFENIARAQLPEEYGENELIFMAVDPNVIFVDWEIRKEEAPEAKDGFTMRVSELPARESPRLSKDVFFDIPIAGRVGRGLFELRMPGREVTIEIGHYDNGEFLPILSSQAVLMPRLLVSDELGIAQKMLDAGIPLGY